MRTKLSLLIILVAGMGCAHKAEERREERREERHEARRDHAVVARADWTKLGERWVEGTHDRDVIAVGARDGRFRRIMLVVEHSALEMFDVVVTFGDGSRFSPPTRHVFSPETRSSVIDLPGADRVIRSVEFRYGNLPGGGKAQLELWAQ